MEQPINEPFTSEESQDDFFFSFKGLDNAD